MRVTFNTLLAATLLILCVGLQVLEATGQWDHALQDTGDEAVIVAVVLCVGSALVAARVARRQFSRNPIQSVALVVSAAPTQPPAPMWFGAAFSTSPPVGLRI